MHDMMLPIIPILPSSVSLPVYDSIEIKNEKTEPVLNLSSPILKPREEVSIKTKIILPTTTRIKQSSSTTAIDRFLERNLSECLTLNHIHDDILIESKSFLDNISFNCTNSTETHE